MAGEPWFLLAAGLAGGGLGAALAWRALTAPLRQAARAIGQMPRDGRLRTLTVRRPEELRLIAAALNALAEQVEEQKRRLREQIAELKRVNEELDRLASLKDDFLVTVNHQLRTPLTSLVEGTELLRDGVVGPLTEEQRQVVRTMGESLERLTHLIEEVLDLSLLKSGHRPLERAPGDLPALLRRAQAEWHGAAESRTIRLRTEELPPVYMDGEAIRDVVHHLLRNALRHAPPASEVLVEARPAGERVEVSVRDRGPGLSPEQLAQLFEPFVHLHTPDAPGSQGGGLGLAFCRQVVERHRGVIRAASAPGQGTTITFTLPPASPQFLFEDACAGAAEDAEYEDGQYGLVLAAASADAEAPAAVLARAEELLRRNTHQGDRLLRLDRRTLALVAVTNQAGLEAMLGRLRLVLHRGALDVELASALFPLEAPTPAGLLALARQRLAGRLAEPPGTESRPPQPGREAGRGARATGPGEGSSRGTIASAGTPSPAPSGTGDPRPAAGHATIPRMASPETPRRDISAPLGPAAVRPSGPMTVRRAE